MSEKKQQRGRPKGTGIDDRPRIQEIGALLAANPDWKPTTAIKAIGITDPSIIRRLRDKFNSSPAASPQSARATGAPAAAAPVTELPCVREAILSQVQAGRPMAAQAAAALSVPRSVKKATLKIVQAGSANSISLDRPVTPPASLPAAKPAVPALGASMLGAWLDLSFTAMKSGIETQIAVMNALVRIPPVAAALRQHAMFNGMALAYLAPERIGRPDAA